MTTMAEPEWDETTRNLALALDRCERVLLCPLCGRPKTVCQHPDNQFLFVAQPPVRCHATTARLAASGKVTEQTNPQSGALLWPVLHADELAELAELERDGDCSDG